MQTLLWSTFRSVMQRPSGVKLWQQPAPMELPSWPFFEPRDKPDEVQATSYFAASASMSSFSTKSMRAPKLRTSVRLFYANRRTKSMGASCSTSTEKRPDYRIAFLFGYFTSLMMGATAFLSVAAEWHPLRLAQPAQALWT